MSVTPGLVIGATGEQVLELHDTLSAIGLSIDPAEKEPRSFGPSTQAAVARLQRICRLTVTGILDEETCAVIAAAGRRLLSVAADGDDWFVVSGHVTWPEGKPVEGVIVRAVNQRLRDEQPLGPLAPEFAKESRTDDCGAYRIPYCRAQFDVPDDDGGSCPSGPDLVVRALGADGSVVAASATLFDAPAHATMDLTVAGAVAGQPPEFHRLSAAIAPLLATPGPPDLSVLQPSDLAYLTGATGWASAYVNDLISAVGLLQDAASADAGAAEAEASAAPAIPLAAFYGLLREGLPSNWSSLLRQQTAAISAALEAAAKDGIVAEEIGIDAGTLAAVLAAIAAQQALTQPGTRQPSPAAQVLAAAGLSAQQQRTVMQAASAGPASPQQFWESLQAEFDAPTVSRLQLTMQLGLLTGNHVPLMQVLLADATVTSPRDLVTRDATAWGQLLATTVNGNPIGTPPGIAGGTPAQQAANYAQALTDTLHATFPTQTAANLAATVPEMIPVSDVRDGVGQFFANAPDFDIRTTRISSYLTANPGTALQGIPAAAQQAVVEQLKRMQRAFQISVSAETMTTLLLAGLDAAHLVANIPPRSFTDRYAPMLGGQDAAQAVYDRAVFINARSIGLITQVNDTVFGTWPAALAPAGSQTAAQQVLASYPDYTELFGALDPCACEDCTSVLSPTAYFVDMLQFLSRSTPNAVGNTPLDVLIGSGLPVAWLGTASPVEGDQVTLALTAGAIPAEGDTIVGGGIPQPATVTAVSATGTYEITASAAIPAGRSATFYGGPAGLWTGTTPVHRGSNVMLLTLTSGPIPKVGDTVIGGGIPGVNYVTAVSGTGPYEVYISQAAMVNHPGQFPVAGGPPGSWLGTATPSGTSHLSMTLALSWDAEPQVGNMLAGGGIAGRCTIAALSRDYTLTTSQTVPEGADVTFAGGAAGIWEATGSPAGGTDQVSLTVETVTVPRSGDFVIGGGLPQPCTVTAVSGTGPYAVTTSAVIPEGADVTFAGASPLGGRRPDLAYLKLTCENTNTELPYIDLVNEVLESYIQYNGPSALTAHDTGQTTSAQLEAGPQYTLTGSTGPYFTLAEAVYPFTLPYNQPIAAARAYLSSLGTSRFQVLSAFEESRPTGQPIPGQATPGQAIPATDAESLGLDPYLYELLTGTDLEGNTVTPALPVAALYGYPPSASGWETATASVPVFLARTGIEITDLIALLGTGFVNPDYPAGPDRAFFTAIPFDYATLQSLAQAGFTSTDPTVLGALADAGMTMADLAAWWGRHQDIGSVLVINSPGGSCDVADGVLAHLADGSPPTDAEYTAMQAFIRLWRVIGWAIADLDRTLSTLGGAITPAFVHALAQVLRLQAALGNLAPQTLLAFWGDLDPDPDGDDSLYGQLFLNPATLPIDPAFAPAPDGAVLQDPVQMISWHLPVLAAALQVSVGDVNLISADASVTALTLTDVSTMCRYAALAQALGMTVADFITLRSLAGATDPFESPDAAVAFVALARAVQQSAFTVSQLGYLYQNDSAPPAGLAPQQTTLLVLAQGLRYGLTQIAAQCAVSDDPKGTRTAAALTQLISKDVATQTVALVNGTAVFTAPLAALPAGITGITAAAANPSEVGAKLSYDPGAGLLRYQGAMTTTEYGAVQAMSPSDADWQTAVTALYTQPATFLTGNLGALLSDPNAVGTLLRATASLDGQLNPVLLDAAGTVVTGPAQAAITEIAVKFGYLLGRVLPYLQDQLSRTFVKQTVSDAFTLDPAVTSLLLEQLLTSPSSGGALIGDLLALITALITAGVTAACYQTPDLSATGRTTSTVTSVDFDGTAPARTLPAGTQSAAFTSWVEVPASATFTFQVQTNGSPALFVGDRITKVTLTPDAAGVPTATVPLTAGQMCYLRLEITALPSGTPPVVVLTWQSPTTPVTPVPTAVQLPDSVYQDFTLAYVRIQKAALLAGQFALTAAELAYLQSAGTGTNRLFGGFDLNALPVSAGITAAQAAALFAAWPRLSAYTTLRNSLPGGSVTLTDVFTAGTFDAASALVPQATGWDPGVVGDLLAVFFPDDAGKTPPTPNTQLVDEIALTNIAACVQLVRQTGATTQQLFGWARYYWPATENQAADQATFDGLDGVADQIRKACAARHDPQAWLTLAGRLSDTLRSSRRDALVAYLLGANGWTDPGQLFDLLLIDPEMGTCMQTSRIRQALNSVQLFVQRCLLNLEASPADRAAVVEPGQIDAATWREWMSAYSLWAANREVFLYPENWLLPALRDDQTELFEAFASSLQQGPVSADSASASFLGYLKWLRQI
jgi:hypothetical protein